MEPLEAAFQHGEYDLDINEPKWFARITFKCRVCGRRNSQLLKGLGTMPLPLKVKCKFGHETVVVPYRWYEEHPELQEKEDTNG